MVLVIFTKKFMNLIWLIFTKTIGEIHCGFLLKKEVILLTKWGLFGIINKIFKTIRDIGKIEYKFIGYRRDCINVFVCSSLAVCKAFIF